MYIVDALSGRWLSRSLYVYNVTFGDGVFDMLLGRSAVAVEATLP
jgi:hypothetical protein